jgi:hypothetical protein
MRTRGLGLVLIVALVAPLGASAQGRGGGARGGGGRPPAANPRAVAPQAPSRQSGGFNLERDISPPASRPAAPVNPGRANPPATIARPPANGRPPGNTRPPVVSRPPVVARPPIANRPPGNAGGGHSVTNPIRRGQRPWDWNRGVTWAPAPAYWGGGFWGPFSLGVAAAALGAAAFGTYTDPASNVYYPSYQVAPGSPGATMLENYQLAQTPCGPPGLVVIFGPDNSVICAAPNDLVGPGEYDLDSSNLTLVSQ